MSGWKGQFMKSWVRTTATSCVFCVFNHFSYLPLVALFPVLCSVFLPFSVVQYMFMFQTPCLPELIISLFDYGMLKAMFRGKRAVSHCMQNFNYITTTSSSSSSSSSHLLRVPVTRVHFLMKWLRRTSLCLLNQGHWPRPLIISETSSMFPHNASLQHRRPLIYLCCWYGWVCDIRCNTISYEYT